MLRLKFVKWLSTSPRIKFRFLPRSVSPTWLGPCLHLLALYCCSPITCETPSATRSGFLPKVHQTHPTSRHVPSLFFLSENLASRNFSPRLLLIIQVLDKLVGISTCVKTCRYVRASQVALVVKNLPANAGEAGLTLGWGRSPGGGHGNPHQYSCLENPMNRGAWRGCKELDRTEAT